MWLSRGTKIAFFCEKQTKQAVGGVNLSSPFTLLTFHFLSRSNAEILLFVRSVNTNIWHWKAVKWSFVERVLRMVVFVDRDFIQVLQKNQVFARIVWIFHLPCLFPWLCQRIYYVVASFSPLLNIFSKFIFYLNQLTTNDYINSDYQQHIATY